MTPKKRTEMIRALYTWCKENFYVPPFSTQESPEPDDDARLRGLRFLLESHLHFLKGLKALDLDGLSRGQAKVEVQVAAVLKHYMPRLNTAIRKLLPRIVADKDPVYELRLRSIPNGNYEVRFVIIERVPDPKQRKEVPTIGRYPWPGMPPIYQDSPQTYHDGHVIWPNMQRVMEVYSRQRPNLAPHSRSFQFDYPTDMDLWPYIQKAKVDGKEALTVALSEEGGLDLHTTVSLGIRLGTIAPRIEIVFPLSNSLEDLRFQLDVYDRVRGRTTDRTPAETAKTSPPPPMKAPGAVKRASSRRKAAKRATTRKKPKVAPKAKKAPRKKAAKKAHPAKKR